MQHPAPFPTWQAVLDAPRSAFFRGRTADTVFDRASHAALPAEALFTQSNARVLLGHAANGTLRMVALPTRTYPAPTGTDEYGLGPGMYHHFDVAMYLGDLSYRILLDGSGAPIDLAADARGNETVYADHVLPLTRTRDGDLDIATLSVAPVAPDAATSPLSPAPLPGPAGALYLLHVRNSGAGTLSGTVVLNAGDLLIGHYEDRDPARRALRRVDIDLRQHTLILTRPDGTVGIHLHDGVWTSAEMPFHAERRFTLGPGEEMVCEAYLALGEAYRDIMPEIFALHLCPALEWVNHTASFWRSRLGSLEVDAADEAEGAQVSRDIYLRSLLDNFNCLQTDREGNLLAHWQGAPSHGYGTIWGIDVEPTATSIAHVCPELALQTLLFFMTRSRAPRGPQDHSVPILVAPIIIARQWLQATGDAGYFEHRPEVLAALEGIMEDLLTLQAPDDTLFPSRFSSDGPVGRRYDYGTNVKVWYAFASMAYLLEAAGRPADARRYARTADGIRAAIGRAMVAPGPFGPQISGGTNLGDDPAGFYLPEDALYYDGEDTSSMLAPIYGMSDSGDERWINYHRFARTLWCPNYDPEFDTLLWSPREPGVPDGTALLSRLGGSVTRIEMREALATLREVGVDDVTGSVFWWPRAGQRKRAVTRCSQGQGAWAWQYLQQWLGITVDAPARRLTLAPRGLLTRVDWTGFTDGGHLFDLHWEETDTGAEVSVTNRNDATWEVRVGFRTPGTAATGPLTWDERGVESGGGVTFAHQAARLADERGMNRRGVAAREAADLADSDGVLFKRFGPAVLWGHWDGDLQWDLGAMPLALRFVILNGSDQDWSDVSVELICPERWTAQGRQPRDWSPPTEMRPGTVRVELGALPRSSRTVAPFWVRGAHTYSTRFPSLDGIMPVFHAPSQPGAGITLAAMDIDEPAEAVFTAELHARAAGGRTISRRLTVPLRSVPGRAHAR